LTRGRTLEARREDRRLELAVPLPAVPIGKSRRKPHRRSASAHVQMALVERATLADREAIERLITAYITAEGGRPKAERVSWAVEQVLKNRFPGALLVAREKSAVVGVVLAVYTPSAELGRVLVVNDFFVDPGWRRKGVGRALATRLLQEAKAMHVDRIDLEVLPRNPEAVAFWKAIGFTTAGRITYSKDIA
jgi:ribosomal protein S18 acetylase RimI-like enzyme